MLKMPQFMQEIFNSIEASRNPLTEIEVAHRLTTCAGGTDLQSDERAGAAAEADVFNLLPTEDSPWETHFGPFASLPSKDGSWVHIPNLANINEGVVDYWETRSNEAQHPVLIARYSDAAWDLRKAAIGQRPTIHLAQRAIDAYLSIVGERLYGDDIVVTIKYIERATAIALSVNDKPRVSRCRVVMLELFSKSLQPGHQGCWMIAYDVLTANKKIGLLNEEHDTLIAGLEAMLALCTSNQCAGRNPWGAQAAAQRLATHYEAAGAKDEVQRVIRAAGIAFESIAEKADPLLAMAWLQPVHDEYKNRGMKEDALRVQKASAAKGKDAHKHFKTISIPVSFTEEELQEIVRPLTDGGVRDALLRIAWTLTPDVEAAKEHVELQLKISPITSMFRRVKIVDDHIAVRIAPPTEDLDSNVIMQLAQELQLYNALLRASLDHLRTTAELTTESILDVLYESPVFVPEQRTLLTEGIQAFLDGDYVKAIHVIVPQIEVALRHLLRLAGSSHLKAGRNGSMQLKNLNDTLREPVIKKSLGDNISQYLLCFLADERGVNLRNTVSHGIAAAAIFNQATSSQVFHALLAVSVVREEAPEMENQQRG